MGTVNQNIIVKVLSDLVSKWPYSTLKPKGVYLSNNAESAVYGSNEQSAWTVTGVFEELTPALVVEPINYKYKKGKVCIKYHLMLVSDPCIGNESQVGESMALFLIEFLNMLGTYSDGLFQFEDGYSDCNLIDWNYEYEFDTISLPNKIGLVTQFSWCYCFKGSNIELGTGPSCDIC